MPEITITMLGGQSSGKTMYLLGLYATMSAGMHGYTLHARDLDQDLHMTAAWSSLIREGKLPAATNETTEYRLVFRQGFTRLIDINWLDYRGGAMDSTGDAQQTAQLVDRLARSDSIYLTIDGKLLAEGTNDILTLQDRTSAGIMVSHLYRAAEARGGPPPSIVILLTKADLLTAGTESPEEALEVATTLVRHLLPAAFAEGTTTMVCPVSLGALGEPDDHRVDRARISPRWVQKPIVFSLARYFEEERTSGATALAVAQSAISAEEGRLADLRGSLFGRFRSGRDAELTARVATARRTFDERRQLMEFATDRDRRLLGHLEGPRYFEGEAEREFFHD
jgi:hypothetical protein